MTPTSYMSKISALMALNLLTLNINAICIPLTEGRHLLSSALLKKASFHHPEIGLRVMIPFAL